MTWFNSISFLHSLFLTIGAILGQVLLELVRCKPSALINAKEGYDFRSSLGVGVLHPARAEGSSGAK